MNNLSCYKRNPGQAIFSALLMIIILSAVALPSALAKDYLVGNSKDWRDLYLVATSAALTNKSFIFFSNLAEAELAMKVIPSDSDVIVYEPNSGSVVKNYEKYLELNGRPASTVSYNGYGELQSELFGRGFDGYVVLEPTFGLEAITSSPLSIVNRYPPLFLTQDTLGGVRSLTNGKHMILAGRFPVRLSNQFTPATGITGMYDDNVVELVRMSYEAKPGNSWGIIGKIDKVDLDTLASANPLIIYYGETETVLRSLNATPQLTNFEVISADMADMARSFEAGSGRDLKLILKFAQTYTNLPGQTGRLFDLKTVPFDYPVESLEIVQIAYYPEKGIVAVTFRNTGNIDVSFFTAIEFAGNALIDENIHTIAPQSTITIPYILEVVGSGSDTKRTVINTRYGMDVPFRKAIESPEGGVVLTRDAEVNNEPFSNFSIGLISADYYDTRGALIIRIDNPTDSQIVAFAEIIIDENTVLSSPLETISPDAEGALTISTPYLTAADLTAESYRIVVYYGEKDTLLMRSFDVPIEKKQELITGLVGMVGSPAVLIPLVILLLIIFLFIILKRRKKERGPRIRAGSGRRGRKRF